MKIKKLELKKEIVANLSEKESKQVRGGTSGVTCLDVAISCPVISCLTCPGATGNCYP